MTINYGNCVFTFGPNLVGKDTLGDRMAKGMGCFHFSTGTHIRSIIDTLSAEDRHTMEIGGLIPDKPVIKFIGEKIADVPLRKTLVLTGAPRNYMQYFAVNGKLSHHRRVAIAAILLQASDTELEIRRQKRFAELGRKDDEKEPFETRLNEYKQYSNEIIELMMEGGLRIIRINTERYDADGVYECVSSALFNHDLNDF
jgi:adenylate kinase